MMMDSKESLLVPLPLFYLLSIVAFHVSEVPIARILVEWSRRAGSCLNGYQNRLKCDNCVCCIGEGFGSGSADLSHQDCMSMPFEQMMQYVICRVGGL